MRVEAREVSRSFGSQKVIDSLSLDIDSGERIAIVGGNGSGKTTFLRLLSGILSPTSGKILWEDTSGEEVARELWPQKMCFTGPYVELIEELSMMELLHFHQKMRPYIADLGPLDLLKISGLEHAQNKLIKYFSSGMKQRLRLTLAVMSISSVVFLDEPTSNFDQRAIDWMRELIENYLGNRTLVVGTNSVQSELLLCNRTKSVAP